MSEAAFAERDAPTSVPIRWDDQWVLPSSRKRTQRKRLATIKSSLATLAELVPCTDRSSVLGPLVGSVGMREKPVHRWFAYKEGFSPELIGALLEEFSIEDEVRLLDTFGGVATTALAGLLHPGVSEVRSVEYSPFAHFVGQTKLSWPLIDAEEFEAALIPALGFSSAPRTSIPSLSSFSNPNVFDQQRLRDLLGARDHIRSLDVSDLVRNLLLLGVAAVVEDMSGVMKDGRALRIKGTRRRRSSSLGETPSQLEVHGAVGRALAGQWSAMLDDVRKLQHDHPEIESSFPFQRGDARRLSDVTVNDEPFVPEQWADVAVFSPPYLNCLDYTELYKLELWTLDFVSTAEQFRAVRLGTLRSHPSIRFPERVTAIEPGLCSETISNMSKYASDYGRRNDVGPMIQGYFEDMHQVWEQQFRALKPGGMAACVVANSTFTRREAADDGVEEQWRMPVLTDVILAHLAHLVGFTSIELFEARSLRPRNASSSSARESVVVARKPDGD